MSLAEVVWSYGKNESSICGTLLNSIHPEQLRFFPNGDLLGIIHYGEQGSTVLGKVKDDGWVGYKVKCDIKWK
jgi:hypothetical protein